MDSLLIFVVYFASYFIRTSSDFASLENLLVCPVAYECLPWYNINVGHGLNSCYFLKQIVHELIKETKISKMIRNNHYNE